MIVYLCYLVLILITSFVIISTVKIVRKTSSIILAIPVIIIYVWSIYGAWSWIPMKLSGQTHYYEDVLSPVEIDYYYLGTLIVYSIFLFVFTIYILYVANHPRFRFISIKDKQLWIKDNINRLESNYKFIIILYVLLFVFVFFSVKDLKEALSMGVSAYSLSRFDSTLGAVGSLITFSGDTFFLLSVILLFSDRPILIKMKILFPILIYFLVNLLLGNRNMLLCGLILTLIFYVELYGIKKAFAIKNIALCVLAFSLILVINTLRGLSIVDIMTGNFTINISEMLMGANNSSEKYAAHISMYYVLNKDVPLTYGSSFLNLISSIVPSFLGAERPIDIYTYYIMQTAPWKPEVGVTINHATGWFLNFGIIGVVLGALVWAHVLRLFYSKRIKFHYLIGCMYFSAVSIQLIRNGPEAYKGVLLMESIIPMMMIYFFLKNKKKITT